MAFIQENDLRQIITNPDKADLLVTKAKSFGEVLTSKESNLSTSQIRALFGEVRQIEAMWGMDDEQRKQARRRLTLLKPKMAYRAKKESGRGVTELVAVLEPALNIVIEEKSEKQQSENFNRFVEFFEAILAYHKAAGGK